MAIVVLSETPNMTAEQYDAVATELGLNDALPDGCLAFVAGIGPDGTAWRDLMIWDEAAHAKEFMDTRLRPAMERAGAAPIWGPPVTWPLHQMIT
jgi:hypothetical protein